jgi:hypothetical protein
VKAAKQFGQQDVTTVVTIERAVACRRRGATPVQSTQPHPRASLFRYLIIFPSPGFTSPQAGLA